MSKNLKIILINNGGGGIFRFIKGPSELSELEEFFETPHQVEIHQLAAAYGLNYLCAQTEKELKQAMRSLYAWEKPTILEVMTPREINDVILKNYFK
ncbi:MAG: thiamine pyrophosphate-dependent enzyme [Bacteroidales bacterium]